MYLLLSTAEPEAFNVRRILLLQQRGENKLEFERIGLSESRAMESHISEEWCAKNCSRTEITLF